MTDNEDMLRQARHAVPDMHMDTPVETIIARGDARRRHRRRIAQASLAGTAAAAAAAVALVGVLGTGAAAPARAGGKGTVRTAAFTLVSNSNGTDTLTLSSGQMFDPATLQRALQQDGVPAMVLTGEFCSSDPAPAHGQVVSVQLPDGQPVGKSTPGNTSPVPSDAVNVIDPAALPAGTEVVFSFMNADRDLMFSVVSQDSYTCSSTPPVSGGGTPPSGGSGNS